MKKQWQTNMFRYRSLKNVSENYGKCSPWWSSRMVSKLVFFYQVGMQWLEQDASKSNQNEGDMVS